MTRRYKDRKTDVVIVWMQLRKITMQYEQIQERYMAAIENNFELKQKEKNIDFGKEHNFTEL